MYAQIQAAIIELINTNAAGLNFNPQWMYNYEPTKPQGYPAISVTSLTGSGIFADTQRNRRDYTFRIRVYQERQTVGTQANLIPQQESERIMMALVDGLINLFDNFNNYNLDNQVQNLVFVKPIPSDWGYVKAPDVDIRIADIKLVAVVVQ